MGHFQPQDVEVMCPFLALDLGDMLSGALQGLPMMAPTKHPTKASTEVPMKVSTQVVEVHSLRWPIRANRFADSRESWGAANGGLRDGGLRKSEDIWGKRPFSSVFWIFQVLSSPSGKGRKRQKKGEKGRFRPISGRGGQTPLKPPFVTPPFAAAQESPDSRESLQGSRTEPFFANRALGGQKLRIASLRRSARTARTLWK